MARFDTAPTPPAPTADFQLAHAQPTAAEVRGQRLAILCLPFGLIALWMGVLVAGEGRVDALGNPVGGDFAMFYVAAQMGLRGEWAGLYDEAFQQARLLELFPNLPADTYLPYRYPPLVAILAAPLALLPYLPAFAMFSLISLALWTASIGLLVRKSLANLGPDGGTAMLAVACAPVAVQTLIDGQASLIWFAIAAACWWSLQRRRYVLAGCVLALAACKPNVMLLLGVALCVRYPRMLIGLVPTGMVMFLVTVAVAGAETLTAYVELGRQLAWKPWLVETPYWKVQSLLSWTEPLFGSAARRVDMLFGLLSAVAIGLWWRRQRSGSMADALALSAALLVNALLNPYTPVYDLTLLCLGLIVCCTRLAAQGELAVWISRRDVQCTAALILVGPILSQGLAKLAECPQQLMPLGLVVAGVYWLGRGRLNQIATGFCTST